jgi:hypothetical protein
VCASSAPKMQWGLAYGRPWLVLVARLLGDYVPVRQRRGCMINSKGVLA